MVDNKFENLEHTHKRLPDRYYVELSFHAKTTADLTHTGIKEAYPSYCQYRVDFGSQTVLLGFSDPNDAMMVRLRLL